MTEARRTHSSRRRAIAAAVIGNAFEWYDFSVFVLFAPFIAEAFFPGESPAGALVNALLAFGVGFVARPVGAGLIGYYADRAGRKNALTITIGLMAAGTLLIAVAPTREVIGWAAPVLIIVGRLLQGLSAGGEIGSAGAFLFEHAPVGQRARFASWLQASMAISNLLGALVALTVRWIMPLDALEAWGWRLPFFLGLLIAPIGMWLRATVEETPDFLVNKARRLPRAEKPSITVMRTLVGQGRNILRAFGISALWGASTYSLIIYMPIHLQTAIGVPPSETFTASLAANALLFASCFVSGGLADRFGYRRVLTIAGWLLVVVPTVMISLLSARSGLPLLLVVEVALAIVVGLYSGAAPAVLAELFPSSVRSTAMSISYNGAITIFSGFAPAIIATMSAGPAGALAPAIYVGVAAIAGLLAIGSLPNRQADGATANDRGASEPQA